MMVKSVFIFVLSMLLLGCFSGKNAVETKSSEAVPAWVYLPPMNSENRFYGVGRADTVEQAEKQALAHLSERLFVTVSSQQTQTSRSEMDFREYVDKQVSQSVSTESLQLNFVRPVFESSGRLGDGSFAVLAEVSLQELSRSLHAQLTPVLNRVQNSLMMCQECSQLEQWQKSLQHVNELLPWQQHVALLIVFLIRVV
jgi:hypothetical protein